MLPVGLAHAGDNNQTALVFTGAVSSEPAFLKWTVTCPWVSTAKCRIYERHWLSRLPGPLYVFLKVCHIPPQISFYGLKDQSAFSVLS